MEISKSENEVCQTYYRPFYEANGIFLYYTTIIICLNQYGNTCYRLCRVHRRGVVQAATGAG